MYDNVLDYSRKRKIDDVIIIKKEQKWITILKYLLILRKKQRII